MNHSHRKSEREESTLVDQNELSNTDAGFKGIEQRNTRRKKIYIAVGVFLLLALILAIALPLALKKSDSGGGSDPNPPPAPWQYYEYNPFLPDAMSISGNEQEKYLNLKFSANSTSVYADDNQGRMREQRVLSFLKEQP